MVCFINGVRSEYLRFIDVKLSLEVWRFWNILLISYYDGSSQHVVHRKRFLEIFGVLVRRSLYWKTWSFVRNFEEENVLRVKFQKTVLGKLRKEGRNVTYSGGIEYSSVFINK